LYAEEFVRLLTDRGLLKPHGHLADASDLPLPDTVQALIAARLDTLAPEHKTLLQDAAVFGKVFWLGALAAMASVSEEEIRSGLAQLQRKELIRGARLSAVEDEVEYTFWHALLRDVAYAQISRTGRSRRHQAAAEWIQALAGDRVADRAELIAYHFTQALVHARAARSPIWLGWRSRPVMRWSWPATRRSGWMWSRPRPTTGRPSTPAEWRAAISATSAEWTTCAPPSSWAWRWAPATTRRWSTAT
jgi:hypothetical protein